MNVGELRQKLLGLPENLPIHFFKSDGAEEKSFGIEFHHYTKIEFRGLEVWKTAVDIYLNEEDK